MVRPNDPDPTLRATPGRPDPGVDGVLGGTSLAESLARWAATASVDEAARARSRVRVLRDQERESATLVESLRSWGERGGRLGLDVAGHVVHGHLTGIGTDFVVVRTDAGADALVALASVAVARRHEDGARRTPEALTGARAELGTPSSVGATLAGVLGPVAADRPDVAVWTTTGATVRGRLVGAGVDVATVQSDGEPGQQVLVAVAAIAVVVVDP